MKQSKKNYFTRNQFTNVGMGICILILSIGDPFAGLVIIKYLVLGIGMVLLLLGTIVRYILNFTT